MELSNQATTTLRPTSITEWFGRQAGSNPGRTALILDERRVSYAELSQSVNAVSELLAAHSIERGDRVAVDVDVSVDAFVSILAALKAGAVCVPIDAALPESRRDAILADAQPKVHLSGSHAVFEASPRARKTAPAAAATSDEVAFVLYTSGSTGRPKGVLVPVSAILSHFEWMSATYPLGPDDVALVYRPCSVIASIWDHFGPLLQGVTTIVVPGGGARNPAAIVAAAAQHDVTHASGSPSLWHAILEQPKPRLRAWRRLRLGLASGETLPVRVVRAWRDAFPSGRLLNVYSATESFRPCIYDTSDLTDADTHVPAGRPVSHARVTIVGDDREPVPTGEVGEICVSGACVAIGYLHQPDLSTRSFARDQGNSERTFRTGDLGRWRPDGTLELVGRSDGLVKVRGNRVELGDVEAALLQRQDVHEVAVLSGDDGRGNQPLVAYLAAPPTKQPPTVKALRRHLRERLPDYMMPALFVVLEALPRTASGKVDRVALQQLPLQPSPAPNTNDESTSTEERVSRIIAKAMGLSAVDRSCNFLELGGHSLMAMQIVARLFDEFAVDLPLHVFLSPELTIAGVAALVDELASAAPAS